MNLSCPNVKKAVWLSEAPRRDFSGRKRCKKRNRKPLIVKLTPNVTDITEPAMAAQEAGADILSLINTLGNGYRYSYEKTVLANNTGTFGPAVRPVAVRMVYQVAQAVSIP